MKLLLDADGCPVVDIAVRLCEKYHIPCTVFCDTAHEFRQTGACVLVFDKGADSVDLAIANRAAPGDLVITQDYGLASLCLARKARALHQDGWEYTLDNIDALLFSRHESRKLRNAGTRMRGPKKRTQAQNRAFERALEAILQKEVQG